MDAEITLFKKKSANFGQIFYNVNRLRSKIRALTHKTINMNTQSTQFSIKEVIFESNDSEVLMKGTQIQGLMSFDVDIIISQSQLNLILGQLQAQNEMEDIMCLFEKNHISENVELYTASFENLFKTNVEIDLLHNKNEIRKIRA